MPRGRKQTPKKRGKGRGKNVIKNVERSPSPENHPEKYPESPKRTDEETTILPRSRSQSPSLSRSRTPSPAFSTTSTSSTTGKSRKSRAKKREYKLKSVDDEEIMISWIQGQECIWNNRMSDYRDTKKKEALWQVKATDMGYTGKYNQIFDINLFSRYHNAYWLEI